MRAFGKFDATRSRTLGHPHSPSTKSEWMDYDNHAGLAPNVWLVRMAPGTQISAHFHTQNQYQIVVEGSGRFGAREVAPFTPHYAGAYTPYGPIVAGPQGLAYFTVRAAHDPGGQHLPEARPQLRQGPRQVWTGPVLEVGAPPAAAGSSLLHQLPSPAGPLLIERVEIPVGGTAQFCASRGDGRFLFVLQGDARIGQTLLGRLESFFYSPEEGRVAVKAGSAGATLLALEMPIRDAAYQSEPVHA